MTVSQHPIEYVHRARDALDQAASLQARTDVARQDLPAYGSALLGVLMSLGQLTHALVEQIEHVDRDRLRREALRDHPHEALERAVEHLDNLRGVLNTAVSESQEYWSETQHVHEDTTDGPTGSEPPAPP